MSVTTTAKIEGDSSSLVGALDKGAKAMGNMQSDARKLSDQLREVADDADKTAGALVQRIGGPGAIKAIAGVGAAFGVAKAGVETFLDSSEALFRSYGEAGQKVWDETEKSLFAIKGAFAEAVLGGGSMEEMGARLKMLFDGVKVVLDALLTPIRLVSEGFWAIARGAGAAADAQSRHLDMEEKYKKAMMDTAASVREEDKAYQDLLKTLGDVVESKTESAQRSYEERLAEIDATIERNREAREYRANAAGDLAAAKALEVEIARGIQSKMFQAMQDVKSDTAPRRIALMTYEERARELLEADQAFQAQLRVSQNAARETAIRDAAKFTEEEQKKENELLLRRELFVQKAEELAYLAAHPPRPAAASPGAGKPKEDDPVVTEEQRASAIAEIHKRLRAAQVEGYVNAMGKLALLRDDEHTAELNHMREHKANQEQIKVENQATADAKKAADESAFREWVGQNAKQVGIAIGSGKKLADIARASIGNVVSALGDKALTEAGLLYAAGDIPSAAAMVAAGVAAYATAGVLGATTKKAAASTPATAAPAPVPQNISYNLRVDAAFADGELVARQFARMQREAGRRGFVTAGAY